MYIKTGEELWFVLRKARLDAYTRFSPLQGGKYEAGVAALRERLIKEGLDPDNEEKESTTTVISMYAPIEEESELLMVAENIIRQQLH